MKIAFNKILAAILFFVVVASPLRAQTNAPPETGMNNAAVTNVNSQGTAIRIDAPLYPMNGEDIKQSLAIMIPIIAIVMGCSIPIVIVGLGLYFRHRKNIVLHETVRTMVDKGVPIPPEMFKSDENASPFAGGTKRPRNDLRTGLIMTCMGVGMVLFIGKPGWIVLFLGVAFLLIASFEKKNKNDDQPPKQ
jgi:hypothetical protein